MCLLLPIFLEKVTVRLSMINCIYRHRYQFFSFFPLGNILELKLECRMCSVNVAFDGENKRHERKIKVVMKSS